MMRKRIFFKKIFGAVLTGLISRFIIHPKLKPFDGIRSYSRWRKYFGEWQFITGDAAVNFDSAQAPHIPAKYQ